MTITLPASIDPVSAAPMLQHWGFLAHSDLPDREGPSWLLVAIRPTPQQTHYDPEEVDYWVTDGERGEPTTLSRLSRLPLERTTTWGMIRVVDRKRETNEWLSFGGRLQAAVVDGAIIAVFTSSAPLFRRGGHSQGWDTGAPSVGAFFAKVRGVAGYDNRFEAMTGSAQPLVRYACFVAEFSRRYRRSDILRKLDGDLWRLVQHEEYRLKTADHASWEGGQRLLAALDAGSTRQLQGDFVAGF